MVSKASLMNLKRGAKDLVNRSLDRHVKLAVTGLSRAGKTAFITALVDHLLQGPVHHQLPLWQVAREGRFLGAQKVPQAHFHIPSFKYEQSIKALRGDAPHWPEPTEGVSEIRLKIKYRPDSLLWRNINQTAELTLDIVDYPGEWLLDLPLLQMTFEQWSEHMMQTLEEPARAELAKDWLNIGGQLDPLAEADEQQIARISQAYTDFLLRSKSELGLHHIQPGRFVLPGELQGAPLLSFFPFVWRQGLEVNPEQGPKNCAYKMLKSRYEHYQEHVVKQFYDQHFVHFDRQIVLLDCLTPLNVGRQSFQDMQIAIEQILQSFNYGQTGLLRRLFAPKIDKLVFAASKADHVTPDQHENLLSLLSQLVVNGQREVAFSGIESHSIAIASVKATQAGSVDYQGAPHPALTGNVLGQDELITLYPGEVPADLPQQSFWQGQGFDFVNFAPQKIEPNKPMPHIRMDLAIEHLLGDKFL
ncbi:YcjX family protein [Motilimonas cestriensis]|uniref:YcjX family protein n=2 Tax=Motilimonas cestriensis TaxID=2742685 RepID=A0ABS8W8N8_9GAMM|nr:YcjX family protein [Motilimonas cestriensis]